MKKTTFLFLFLSILTIVGFGQEKKSLDSSYINYFKLTREIPYLHLNKTSFIKGEEIWFQAYILNQKTKKLHTQTTNLNLVIYNEKGVYKQSKLFFVENGIATGNIKIDSTFTDKIYYVKVSTNWMRNFEEDEPFIQKIQIISNKKSSDNIVESDSNYDLQLLPEGGHLVESTNAVVGIIIKNKENKGVQIKYGVLLDDKNKVIKKLSTNQFGLGKVSFYYKPNTNYKVKITTQDDEDIIKNVEPAKKTGFTLNVENPNSTFIKLNIETNTATLQNTLNKKYYIYIHNKASLLKVSFVLNDIIKLYNFTLSVKKLPKGINIITVVNENNKPISERIFFNYDKKLLSKTNYEIIGKSKDSLTLQLSKTNNQVQYLSTTFLPKGTKSYSLKNTMYSKFLLKPFIKGDIENSSYYFKNTNRKKLANLDLLLLTQGWSKYNWYNIFNVTPKIKFEFEKGITIKGGINSTVKDSTNIFLLSPQNNLFTSTQIVKNKFSFKNIFLTDSSDVGFIISSGKGKFIKPKIYSNFYPKLDKNNIQISKNYDYIKVPVNINNFISNRILLDEVVIKAKLKKKRSPTRLYGSATSYNIIDGDFFKSENILSFLNMKGFLITRLNNEISIQTQRGATGFYGGRSPVEVFLDDVQIVDQYQNNITMISNFEVGDFEEILISKSFNGQIFLYTNKNIVKKTYSPFNKVINPIGFAKEKSYYKPNYYSTTDAVFKNYGAIFWKPNIKLDKDNYTFKIPHLNQEYIKMYIEGIANDGSIIYEEKTITVK